MSIAPLRCCDIESAYSRTRPFPAGQTTTYMVWWRCPTCDHLSGELGSLLSPDEEARRAIGALPPDPVAASREAHERGLLRRSLAILDMALEADPKGPALHAEKGRQLFHAQFADLAVTTLEKAIELGDATPATRGYLGLALSDTERRVESVTLLEAAILGEPGGGIWWHGWIRVLVRLLRYDEAEAGLSRAEALALEPAWRGGLLTEKANILCARKLPAEALLAADEAIRLAPASTYAHYVRGRALGLLGRIDDAEAAMDQILLMAPGDPDATSAKTAYADARPRR